MKQLKYIRQKNYVNADITKINLDNQSYLNQLYENNKCFFNIPPVHAKNPRSNKKATVQSPLNQFSETLGFLSPFFSLLGFLAITNLFLCQHFHFCLVNISNHKFYFAACFQSQCFVNICTPIFC